MSPALAWLKGPPSQSLAVQFGYTLTPLQLPLVPPEVLDELELLELEDELEEEVLELEELELLELELLELELLDEELDTPLLSQTLPVTCGICALPLPLVPCTPIATVVPGAIALFHSRGVAVYGLSPATLAFQPPVRREPSVYSQLTSQPLMVFVSLLVMLI